MTCDQFNEKYKDYLEDGHYGLAIGGELLIEYLDKKFQEFIKLPGFKYSQIKLKFGMARFYCDGLSADEISIVEKAIEEYSKH